MNHIPSRGGPEDQAPLIQKATGQILALLAEWMNAGLTAPSVAAVFSHTVDVMETDENTRPVARVIREMVGSH